MGFQVSPGVNVSEIDLTTIIPAVSTTTGAFAGHFDWGPVGQRVLVDSEDTLVKQFHEPNANTAADWFTAANFLAYGNALYTVRVINANTGGTVRALNSAANTSYAIVIKNEDDYNNNFINGTPAAGSFVAKYPGQIGNNLRVSLCFTANAYESQVSGATFLTANNVAGVTVRLTGAYSNLTVRAAAFQTVNAIARKVAVTDNVVLGPDKEFYKVSGFGAGSSNSSVVTAVIGLARPYVGNTFSTTSLTRRWEFFNNVPGAPGTSTDAANNGSSNDEMHVVVVDEKGGITGTAGTILEVFPALSKAGAVKSQDGTSITYKDYINKNSRWIWWNSHPSAISSVATKKYDTATNFGAGIQSKPTSTQLGGGRDGALPRTADYINAYNLFRSSEAVDVSLIIGGASNQTVATHIINNIAEYRKDCVAVFSPRRADVVNNSGYAGAEVDDIVEFRNLLPSTSYAVIDSGWKYQYDKYADTFRYVPCNGDTAGTMVRTDIDRDPWYSPAGYNRGQIKNVVKLAFNPNKTERDALYKAGINPITTFPGEGTILFGDKTMLTKPSAFDRINVRRLFIVLEKAIATAAKYTLFEFNDAFTRAQFKALVEPFLRDVQGRRGITDFRVVCDETNNTPEVIDRNEFIGDIYIKPARSINFIQLNFVAVRTGVDFTEVVGKF
jgi:phage tail sheath protein FI